MSEMATMTREPSPKDVLDLLEGLLGRDVTVDLTSPYSPEPGDRAAHAVYVDDRLTVRAVAVCDLAFSAYAGAAIGLVPPGGAQDAVAERLLTPSMEENLYEVLNVCAALLNAEGHPHVKLYAMHSPMTAPPQDVAAMGQVLGRRLDLSVTIAGYGQGRLSIVGVA
ncbi:MAG: hypothetical protein J7518_01575 [Nocardioidaceae bacterium]|nr:hypothetical protein [Nocardioidaceae bacterium]